MFHAKAITPATDARDSVVLLLIVEKQAYPPNARLARTMRRQPQRRIGLTLGPDPSSTP